MPSSLLYAFDPMEEISSEKKSIKKFLKKWNFTCESLSVVHSPSILDPKAQKRWQSSAYKELKPLGIRKSSFIFTSNYTREGSAREFLEASRKKKFQWIAVNSHARWGLTRWAMGSFAEDILLKSNVPVIFLPDYWQIHEARELFFVTDFSPQSFRQLSYIKKHLNLDRVVLFHALNFPVPYVSAEYTLNSSKNYFLEQEQWAKQQAFKWKKRLGKELDFQFHLDPTRLGFLTGEQILLAASKHNIDFLSISSQSNLVERIFFGSASYQLFRKKSLPVIVFGSQFGKRKK